MMKHFKEDGSIVLEDKFYKVEDFISLDLDQLKLLLDNQERAEIPDHIKTSEDFYNWLQEVKI